MKPEEEREYESFSSLVKYDTCPNQYRLHYDERIRYPITNSHILFFGSQIHNTLERNWVESSEILDIFKEETFKLADEFFEDIDEETGERNNDLKYEDILKSYPFAKSILTSIEFAFEEKFWEGYDVEHVELELDEHYEGFERNFKGYVDLIIQTTDGKYWILDYKTCEKPWNDWKKNDPRKLNQLLLYKYFFHKKTGIPLENIDTGFVFLIKRKRNPIQFFDVVSDEEAIEQALEWFESKMNGIQTKFYIKNPSALCDYCPYGENGDCDKRFGKVK